ncbi:type II toxin-antitoxin system Phd/YefM family antitoxin [Zoogloea sp.]|uniref:type II toxin-antitoxin system Phd/YefM family antitoxin n=1 Tax=Zoogloea sp. TaxID=49181 RepID=UPI0032207883
MDSTYSIAEARDALTGLIHRVEEGEPIQLTRRGRPVAVLISVAEYQRLKAPVESRSFGSALDAWRLRCGESVLHGDEFDALRDAAPGRSAADF